MTCDAKYRFLLPEKKEFPSVFAVEKTFNGDDAPIHGEVLKTVKPLK